MNYIYHPKQLEQGGTYDYLIENPEPDNFTCACQMVVLVPFCLREMDSFSLELAK